MAEDKTTLELLVLLDLPQEESVDERLWRWALAYQAWLEARRTGCHSSIGFLSFHAWREFLSLIPKPPWEVAIEDINTYISSLEQRGLRPGTISGRLSALGSFYAYCAQRGVDALSGPEFNPVKGVRRPKYPKYELEERGIRLDPLDAAVLRWRIVAKRAALMWKYVETVQQGCRVLKVVGQACVNVARTLKMVQQIRAMARELDLEGELQDWWGDRELPR